jgi:hypothetical protein
MPQKASTLAAPLIVALAWIGAWVIAWLVLLFLDPSESHVAAEWIAAFLVEWIIVGFIVRTWIQNTVSTVSDLSSAWYGALLIPICGFALVVNVTGGGGHMSDLLGMVAATTGGALFACYRTIRRAREIGG